MLSMKFILICMLASTTLANHLRTTVGADPSGIVMIDGGSTGSKLASYIPGKKKIGKKVLTQCAATGTFDLKGVSAYAYDGDECKPTISAPIDEEVGYFFEDDLANPSTDHDWSASSYAQFLLEQLKNMHETGYVKIYSHCLCLFLIQHDTYHIQFFYHFYC